MSKWKNELIEEKLQDQIQAARQVYQNVHWRVFQVEYWESTKSLLLLFELKEEYRISGQKHRTSFAVEIQEFKCLSELDEKEIEKVSLLGERAIQWEDLDIQIGLDDLLMSVQLRENWSNSLK